MTPEVDRNDAPLLSPDLPVETHAAALSVEIRTPLAQIELAASQLFREALTPNTRAQSEQIFEAVAEIDCLVERMLRVLVPRRREWETQQDLASVLSELRRRFAPALSACGVEWKWREPARSRVIGNLERVRRLCTELLHQALTLSGEGGQFTLGMVQREQGIELTLFCRRAFAWTEAQLAAAHAAVRQSQAFALEAGGTLSGTIDALTSDLRLVVPNQPGLAPTPSIKREEACRES